jgi:hypothetical protein
MGAGETAAARLAVAGAGVGLAAGAVCGAPEADESCARAQKGTQIANARGRIREYIRFESFIALFVAFSPRRPKQEWNRKCFCRSRRQPLNLKDGRAAGQMNRFSVWHKKSFAHDRF